MELRVAAPSHRHQSQLRSAGRARDSPVPGGFTGISSERFSLATMFGSQHGGNKTWGTQKPSFGEKVGSCGLLGWRRGEVMAHLALHFRLGISCCDTLQVPVWLWGPCLKWIEGISLWDVTEGCARLTWALECLILFWKLFQFHSHLAALEIFPFACLCLLV